MKVKHCEENLAELRAKKPCRVFCKALCSSCDIPRLPVDEWQICGSKACIAKVVVSQWAATAPHVSLRVHKMKTPMLRDPRHSHKYNDFATRSKELGPSTTSTNMVNLHRASFFIILPRFLKRPLVGSRWYTHGAVEAWQIHPNRMASNHRWQSFHYCLTSLGNWG